MFQEFYQITFDLFSVKFFYFLQKILVKVFYFKNLIQNQQWKVQVYFHFVYVVGDLDWSSDELSMISIIV